MEKVALITGGSRGIGKGIAIALATEGYAIAIVGTKNYEAIIDQVSDLEAVTDKLIYISVC